MKLFYILYRKRHEQIPMFLIQFVFFESSDTNTRSCDVSLLEATCQVPKRVSGVLLSPHCEYRQQLFAKNASLSVNQFCYSCVLSTTYFFMWWFTLHW